MNSLLAEDNDWRMITSVLTDVLDAQFGVTVLPNCSARRVRPIIESVSADQYRLVIPIGQQEGKPVVAVGTLDAKPGEILEKLLGVAVQYVRQGRRLEEQRLDLDSYARQISRDFEELTWLRGLLQRLKDCDKTDSAENLGESVLRPLCPLIGAEQIVLVSASHQADIPDAPLNRQQSTSPGQQIPPVGKAVVRVGSAEQVVSEQSCCKLVDRLREVAGTQSLVQTGMKRKREFSMVPEVDCCILVPVIKQESLLGWLLAVNRASIAVDSDAAPCPAPSHPPEKDFGSFEANLLDFAAVILAAHVRCDELFGQRAVAQTTA